MLISDHVPSIIQAKKKVKADSKYEKVNLVVAEAISG